jgi:hypothetical protein
MPNEKWHHLSKDSQKCRKDSKSSHVNSGEMNFIGDGYALNGRV